MSLYSYIIRLQDFKYYFRVLYSSKDEDRGEEASPMRGRPRESHQGHSAITRVSLYDN